MAEGFGSRLATRVGERGALCVGIDPSARLLEAWGRADTVEGLEFAARALVESVADVATAVKVQVAYFERFAAAGYRVLETVIAEARDADLLVVGDVKRGDIPSTNEGYAQAWLGGGPLGVDAITVSPYLGVESLAPFLRRARDNERGVFILAATSNDEGRRVQTARTDLGDPLEETVLDFAAQCNARDDGRGDVGVVWGANRDAPRFDLAHLGGPVLVPGVGAQGATPADVARVFARCPRDTVLANVARALAVAGPERRALSDAASRWRDDLAAALA